MSTTAEGIDTWFRQAPTPTLIGRRCRDCGTSHFPPLIASCANPKCGGQNLEAAELSRRGRIWSYTDARYQPPPPYVPPAGGHQPFAIAAVELEVERMVILGQVASGFGVDDLTVGAEVEVVIEPLDVDSDSPVMVWKWRPVDAPSRGGER